MVYQIDDATASPTPPAMPAATGSPGYFDEGDPATGRPATLARGWWFNMVMMELINAVKGAGIVPDRTANDQLWKAIQAHGTSLAEDLLPRDGSRPMTGDLDMTGHNIRAGKGTYLSMQADGNIVAYRNGKAIFAFGQTGDKDQGSVGSNVPLYAPTPPLATRNDMVATTSFVGQVADGKVAGDQGIDDYSLKIRGIKSQYLDTAKKTPAGIEYIDEAGLYMLVLSKSYADSLYASQSSLAALSSNLQNELSKAFLIDGSRGMQGDISMNGHRIWAGNGCNLTFQNDGNIVAYRNGKAIFAFGQTGDKGQGTVGSNVPLYAPTSSQTERSDMVATTKFVGQVADGKVAGDQGIDDYSLKVRGIKSQYLDTEKKTPAGLEYIDEAGLYMLVLSKSYADSLYASQSSLAALSSNLQNELSKAFLIDGSRGMQGDISMNGHRIWAGNGCNLTFQNDGNIVAYRNEKAIFAFGQTGDKGQGTVASNVPLYAPTPPLATRNDMVATTSFVGQVADGKVNGDKGIDDYSLKIRGIKSQYLDTTKKTPAGIEYIDEAGLYMLVPSKSYADTIYASQASVSGLQNQVSGKQAAGNYLRGDEYLGPQDIQGSGVHTDNSGPKPNAQYSDKNGNNFGLARADDLSNETQARKSADAAETAARQDAVSQMVSGTYGRAPGDAAGVTLHTDHLSGQPYYGDSNGHGGNLAYYDQLVSLIRVLTQKPLVCTSGGTITTPTGIGHAEIEFVGGGGGGSNTNGSGGGGGSGAYAKILLALSAGTQFSVIIGGGGNKNGGNGGSTRLTFGGAWIEAAGGAGAPSAGSASSPGGGGGSVSWGNGFDPANIIIASTGNCGADGTGGRGNGAPGVWGGSGRAGAGGGVSATGYGAGGGGAYSGGDGGSGSQGLAIIKWLP